MTGMPRPYQITKSSSFTRPADTTAYEANDLVANDTTAADVDPLTFAFGKAGWLRKARLTHTQALAANSTFKLWLLTEAITPTNGDNGAFGNATLANVLAVVDLTVDDVDATDGTVGEAFFDHGAIALPDTAFGYVQAVGAYAPASGEVFVASLTIDAI